MNEIIILVIIVVIAVAIGKALSSRRKKTPILKESDIEPADAPVSTVEAKKIYRQYITARAKGNREELRYWVDCFADEMREEGESNRVEIADTKETVSAGKARIKELKSQVRDASGDDEALAELKEQLEDVSEDTKWHENYVQELQDDLKHFRKDKRSFLISYINTEIHGPDWRERAEQDR